MSSTSMCEAETQAAEALRKHDEPYKAMAQGYALEASTTYFNSRRGVLKTETENVVVLYNNNPYAGHPAMRDGETDRIRARLKRAGMQELSYALYPTQGADAGYSYAMVIDTKGNHQPVEEIVQRETEKSILQMSEPKPRSDPLRDLQMRFVNGELVELQFDLPSHSLHEMLTQALKLGHLARDGDQPTSVQRRAGGIWWTIVEEDPDEDGDVIESGNEWHVVAQGSKVVVTWKEVASC